MSRNFTSNGSSLSCSEADYSAEQPHRSENYQQRRKNYEALVIFRQEAESLLKPIMIKKWVRRKKVRARTHARTHTHTHTHTRTNAHTHAHAHTRRGVHLPKAITQPASLSFSVLSPPFCSLFNGGLRVSPPGKCCNLMR